jgi:hypothetical protein
VHTCTATTAITFLLRGFYPLALHATRFC